MPVVRKSQLVKSVKMYILEESSQVIVYFLMSFHPSVPASLGIAFSNYYLLRLLVCPLLSGMAHWTNALW